MFRAGLWIQFAMAVWMVFSALMGIDSGRWWSALRRLSVVCRWFPSNGGHFDEFPHGRNAPSLAWHFPLWYWRYRRRVAVAGYLYQCVADDLSIAPLRRLVPFCFILYASRPKNGDGRGVPQWRRRRRWRWGRYPLHDAKPNDFHS